MHSTGCSSDVSARRVSTASATRYSSDSLPSPSPRAELVLSGPASARIRERPQGRLDLSPSVLEHRWQRQRVSKGLERLIDGHARTSRGDLEQRIARLAEVDAAKVEALEDGGRRCNGGNPPLPGLDVLILARPGNMIDGPCAAATGARQFVVGDE